MKPTGATKKMMRIRVGYSTEVDDRYRRAINHYLGLKGLATRDEVKEWLRQNGSALDEDILSDLDNYEQAICATCELPKLDGCACVTTSEPKE